MPEPGTNNFWESVKHPGGRPNAYEPDELWEKALEYFKWVNDNPLYELKVFSNGEKVEVPKMRAMSESAFCLFSGIQRQTLNNYKSGKAGYEKFLDIATTISNIIYNQKFEGAAADFLNANIIARDLGLREHSEMDVTSGGEKLNGFNYVQPDNTAKSEAASGLDEAAG